MPTTATVTQDLRRALDSGQDAAIPSAAKLVKLGNMLPTIKVVASGLSAAAAFDITTAAFKAKCVVTGITLNGDELLLPVGAVASLRVVTGAANTPGNYVISDSVSNVANAGTGVGVAYLSDDGKTIQFAGGAAVTAFTLVYQERAATDLTTAFAIGGMG